MSFFQILQTIFIGPLKLIFELIFYFAYKIVNHPGLAIIVLSLAMNTLVLPLYRRADAMQEASRDVEAKLAPGVAHIKKSFSGDERMMILQTYYRQNHYKPTDALKGSVSLLLEVPFFMAAYQFLSGASALKDVTFGPIANLGAPDGLLVIGSLAINVLPVLMTAINVISSAIYLKGFPMKTKVQLYAMAAFFLVFLYNSPSGLVFYWTLNNLFSLVKTIFYKLKNPKRAGMLLLFAAGIGILLFGMFFYPTVSAKKKLLLIGLGSLLCLAPLASFALSKLPAPKAARKTSKKMFVLSSILLTVLVGFLIPSTLLSASPQEFVDPTNYYNPLFYVLYTGCMAAGTFLVWLQVFYWLANDQGKVIFEKILWILCGVMLVNYMFFGTNLGIISANLQYQSGLVFSSGEKLLNLALIPVLAILLLLCLRKWPKASAAVALVAAIALGGMSGINLFTVRSATSHLAQAPAASAQEDQTYFTLSQTSQNVVVIMLDRAMGQTVPYIFQEMPQLQDQFSGFTFYNNTISFGGNTNFAMPAMLGGYEYTPVELNRRSEELLKDKHNEALKVMPVLFSQNGYNVTVCDPGYANYQWIPDPSIYDDYPEINAYVTEGAFTPAGSAADQINTTSRNFFCFSVMKTMPLVVQPFVYNNGSYNQLEANSIQVLQSTSAASGLPRTFLNRYLVLENLENMTDVTTDDQGSFLFLANNTTHDPYLLQAPDYKPAAAVDNTAFDVAHADRFTIGQDSIRVETPSQMAYYHVNMAAFLQLGQWFDYLRDNDLYDNTRIILVADHGGFSGYDDSFTHEGWDLGAFFPLLMVKDFNSNGDFTTSTAFMTNADVPALAAKDVIDNPVNPFTGKAITDEEKTAHRQFITLSNEWDVEINNGNTFLPSAWISVQEDIHNPDNWTIHPEILALDRHSAP